MTKTTAKKNTTKKTASPKKAPATKTPAKPPKATPSTTTTGRSTAPAATTTVKKGDLYETKSAVILEVTNGRLKDEGEQGFSFTAREITFDAKTLKAEPQKATDRYYLDELVRKLTKKDFEEWVEVNRREAEAVVDATTPAPATTTDRPAKEKPAAKPKRAKTDGKMSAIDAAAKVLAESGKGMRCKDLIDAMSAKGYWTSPGGATPHATLYSAILREINTKGAESRFKKLERGLFAATT